MKSFTERRLHPRLEHRLPLEMAVNGYDFNTQTHNLSCVGAYCRINKYMPPFTKVSIRLNLPKNIGQAQKDRVVECQGVIVRSEDGPEGGFNVAIFFNQIQDKERMKLSRYVNQFLP